MPRPELEKTSECKTGGDEAEAASVRDAVMASTIGIAFAGERDELEAL